ncbi:hypothetical protein Phi12:1_gp38 [Cellulophaga phage phi12:1]|uniref:Uncharacterized protein n=2 Tax=Cellulophaga phage phi12:1 TaxID=1327976 RepID=R9ZXL7_9CAUD|nr:hypothetical protein Phi12:1_gp38 [Cellulophaga phage phi12:1]AGO48004.1 hypothetical protein Phi12:1_gp38 [Cellulophaga phage phi12:1]AGO48169.1 hypothetical protein Phi12:3_gp38 [Cellulophaga phage phi12:3]
MFKNKVLKYLPALFIFGAYISVARYYVTSNWIWGVLCLVSSLIALYLMRK